MRQEETNTTSDYVANSFGSQPILAKVAKMLVSADSFVRNDDFPPNAFSNLRKVEQSHYVTNSCGRKSSRFV